MTLWENVLAHYGWQGAALAAVLVVLLCVQLWYYLFAYGRIPGYKNSRRRQVLDAEPPLSVIVPMFSEDALFVEERLPLMLAQEYSDFEVVIVYVGRDNDFFEDLLRIRQSFPRVTATKIEQDARFPISTKMALNVGIKSAHYEHLIVTSTDVRPLSDRWLALMAKGFLRGDVVVGYCGLERRRGLADRWMRTDRMMESVQWLARAVAHRPYRGSRYNFGFTKRLYFDARGFSHLNMNIGEDDLFLQRILRDDNLSVVLSPRASVVQRVWGGLGSSTVRRGVTTRSQCGTSSAGNRAAACSSSSRRPRRSPSCRSNTSWRLRRSSCCATAWSSPRSGASPAGSANGGCAAPTSSTTC